MADQKQQSMLMRAFTNVFSAAFPQNDVEGVGINIGDFGYDLTGGSSSPMAFDGELGSPDVSKSDLPAREITNIDGGYDALSRRQRYASYEQLEELVPEIHSSLNTYADEACSYDDDNHVLQIVCASEAVKEELKFLFFNSNTIDVDTRAWGMARNLCKYGDGFWELVIDPHNPQFGVLKLNELDPHTMWRIQSRKGTLLEFQQTPMSPDYEIVVKEIKERHNKDKNPFQSLTWGGRQNSNKNMVRFAPAQVVHVRIGSEERGFKPYGMSVLQPARRAAYNLRLMEDSMLLYRLCLSGDTRVRTSNGWKKISSVKPGDIVQSYMPDGSTVSNVVVDAMNNGAKKTYRIRSRHVEIIATDNHPILVHKNGVQEYVDVKDLIVGKHQFINVARREEIPVAIPRFTKEVVAKLSDAQRESLKCESSGERSTLRANGRWGTTDGGVSTLRKWGKHDTKDAAIESIVEQTGLLKNRVVQFIYVKGKCLSIDVARLICSELELDPSELIICNKGENNPERINLPDFVDEDFARLVGFLIGDGTIGKNYVSFCGKIDDPTSKYYHSLLEKYFGKVGIDPDKRRTLPVGRFRVTSTAAADTLRALGLKVGPHLKRIPSWAFTASLEIRRALVEGLSDADGHERYTKRGTWFSTIRMCNKNLIEDVKELWSSIGLASGHVKRIDTKQREIDGRTIQDTAHWEVTISELPLDRFENILSIEEHGDVDVFDISVDGAPHNFVANGVPVHNSRGTERRVYYVDVGQMSGTKVDTYIEQFKSRTKRKRIYNEKTQQVDERFNPWPVRRGTMVPLQDGRLLAIEDIAKEYEEGKKNWVFSLLDDTRKVVPGFVAWCGKNYRCKDMVRVLCDDGGHVDVAPEHPFVLCDGSSRRADELAPGDCLMPLPELATDTEVPLSSMRTVSSASKIENEVDDVYCMTVVGPRGEHDRHNFALKCAGTDNSYIFVKNSVDDDLYIPIRPNTNTRVDVLPGASNLSDLDDALYFRKKLYVALKIPPGYLEQTIEAATNRLSLTSLDMRFAKVVFRIQKALANAFREVAIRHLVLLGVPREEFDDLEIVMTPSSEWREIAQSEVMQNRINLASSIKSMDIAISDDWIMERIFKLPDDEISREKERKRRQEIERAELEGTKLLIAARYQAEIDRGNVVNQAMLQQLSQPQGGETPPPANEQQPPSQDIPSEEDLFAAAEEPNEEPVFQGPETGARGMKKPVVPPRAKITRADIEAERGS